ncbi:MAG: hypothetical protein Q4A44_03025 [Bacteroidales bacterium]|nr:hypothetical protein [Bacteroidales bacterium]
MFGQLLNGQALQTLKYEAQRYLASKYSEVILTFIVKMTLLLSALAVVIVLFAIGILVAFYASFALTAWLEQLTGSAIVSYALMAGVFLVIAAVVYLLRKSLIERPIATLLTRIFYSNDYGAQSANPNTSRTVK